MLDAQDRTTNRSGDDLRVPFKLIRPTGVIFSNSNVAFFETPDQPSFQSLICHNIQL